MWILCSFGVDFSKIIKNEYLNFQGMIFVCTVITSYIHVGHTLELVNIISGELPSLEYIFISVEH